MSLPPRPAPSLPDVARDCRITAAAAAAASAGPPPRLHRSGGHLQVRPRGAAARPGLIPACRFWCANGRARGLARPGDRTGPAPRLPRVRRCRTVRDAGIEFGRRASARVAGARPAGTSTGSPPPAARHGPRDQDRTRDGTASLLLAARPVTTPPEGRPGQRGRERSSRTRRPGPAGTARPPAGGRSRRSCSVAAAAAIATLGTNLLH